MHPAPASEWFYVSVEKMADSHHVRGRRLPLVYYRYGMFERGTLYNRSPAGDYLSRD